MGNMVRVPPPRQPVIETARLMPKRPLQMPSCTWRSKGGVLDFGPIPMNLLNGRWQVSQDEYDDRKRWLPRPWAENSDAASIHLFVLAQDSKEIPCRARWVISRRLPKPTCGAITTPEANGFP